MITISYLIVLIIFSTNIHIISQILYVKLTISITTVPLKSEKVLWNYWNIVSYRDFSSERTWNFIFAVVLLWPHMFQDKFVFAQLVAFFDRSKFNRIVAKYNGDRYVKHLTCWNQFLAMMFGQLSNRESLRDLIVALEAHHSKCYHLGMGKNVSKSSLARANQDRDYRIFEEYAFYLVSEVRKKCSIDIFKLDGNVYAFDSTTIDLCLEVFWWAKFRKKKGGIKVHTLYDVETQIPTFFPELYILQTLFREHWKQ